MTSQLEGIFPRRTAAETADCAEKVGQIGSRMLTDNEFKPFHLSVENLVFHSSLSMAVLWVRPTIDSQKNYNSRSIS